MLARGGLMLRRFNHVCTSKCWHGPPSLIWLSLSNHHWYLACILLPLVAAMMQVHFCRWSLILLVQKEAGAYWKRLNNPRGDHHTRTTTAAPSRPLSSIIRMTTWRRSVASLAHNNVPAFYWLPDTACFGANYIILLAGDRFHKW